MKQMRVAVLAALLAGASVGLASPASAEPLSGSYTATYTIPNGKTDTHNWVFTPCGPGCSHLEIDPPNHPDASKDFQLQGNTWSYNASDGCSETINNDTLAGSWNCDPFSFQFQLAKTG